jgi:hypothetical protein
MRATYTALALALVLLMSGCASVGLESKRLFQDKVPEPAVKKVEEDIKVAADHLARHVEEPQEAADVSFALSQRVGPPKAPNDSVEAVKSLLRKGSESYEKEVEENNKWLDKREGVKLEGTGLSVWGTGGLLVGVVALGVLILVPAFIPLAIQIVQVIAGTSRSVLTHTVTNIKDAVEEFNAKNPEAAEELKQILSKRMDAKEKAIIKKAKSNRLK